MWSMTEDFVRLADGIVTSRRERMEANAERHREAGGRHHAVGDQMHEMTMTRGKMGRQQHRDAVAGRRERLGEVESMLRRFHRNREDNAAAARMQAAAFMRDLTGRVASLRDAFAASQETRAASRHDMMSALHERLAGYRQDRHDAGAAWHGMAAQQAAQMRRPGRNRAMHAASSEDRGSR